jgi:protoheme ferro-lyase
VSESRTGGAAGKYLPWVLLIVLSGALGFFVVEFMTVHPLRMSLYLLLAALAAFAIVGLIVVAFRGGKIVAAAVVVALVFFSAGYTLDTERFLSREDSRPVPEITRAEGDTGDGHTAVVYFTHGEPETYDPVGWINQFNEFDEQGVSFVPLVARPFFVYQLRNAYLEVGSSHHRGMHMQMLQSLEDAYRSEGDTTTRFYISFLDDDPRPDAAVIQALNEGASRIIVSEVFLTISNHTAEGEELIEAVDAGKYGATLEFTGPLWDSDTLRSMFTQRVARHRTQDDVTKVGILLVGHGQPDEWDEEWPTETDQEIDFREGVLDLFEQQGYLPENLSLAWMSFKEPKPAPKVEEFVANGVQEVFFFSAAISADSIHSQFDIPELVYEADVPETVSIVNMGAWNDDPLVIQAIKEKIDALMN